MSSEGATNPVAADTTTSAAPEVETNETNEAASDEGLELDTGEGEGGEEVAAQEPELEEIEFEGEKVRVPKKIKEGLLRQADYTRKTQELAEQRKAFDASREASTTVHKDYVEALASVKAYDAQLARYENVDWATLEATDPAAASSHWRTFTQLKDARSAAEKTAGEKEQSLAMESQRQRATRAQEVQAELTKLLPDWTPGGELDLKLAKFGTANGLSQQDIAEATLRNPSFVKLLNLARIGADLQAKDAATKKITAAQAVKPAAEVGSRSATATKDPARMSQAAYVKWRESQG